MNNNGDEILVSTEKSTMKAYRYKDDKSDKFWRIEYTGNAAAINYGKVGGIGKYQIKEFDSEGECKKEVKRLIAAKEKKGYQPYPEFDPTKHCYLDDDEFGLHPLTSHPKFRAYFTNAFYYDCVDEETPFGSDEGNDTLADIGEYFRKNKLLDFSNFPEKLMKTWGMTYIEATDLSREAVERLVKGDEIVLIDSDMVTYATAFAQIKITGCLNARLKEMALNAMERMKLTAQILGWSSSDEPSEILLKMISNLKQFPV